MNEIDSEKVIDIPEAWIKIIDDSILHIHTKVKDEFELPHAQKIAAERVKFCGNKKYPILHTAEKFVIPSQEVREFVATEERSKLITADAFVVRSLPQRIAANFFMRFNNPVRPTRIFDSKEEAIEWLRQFIE